MVSVEAKEYGERPIYDCDDTFRVSKQGEFLRWGDEQIYRLEIMPNGKLGFRVIFECPKCTDRGAEFYIGRGAPGWCYAYDLISGKFAFDIRSQDWVCEGCTK